MTFKVLDRVKTSPKAHDHLDVKAGVIVYHNPTSQGFQVVGPDSRVGWFKSEELELDVQTCATCKHWGKYDEPADNLKSKSCWLITRGLREGNGAEHRIIAEVEISDPHERPDVRTGPDFSCNQWEKKS